VTTIGNTENLFGDGEATDLCFRHLRDPKHEWEFAARSFAERLWAIFRDYADAHFLIEIQREFNARFWEMYLTCALLERASEYGYSLSCPKRKDGCPDILLELKGERIWIEAVAATNGEAGMPDSLVEPRIPTIAVGDRAEEQQAMDLPIEPGAAESGTIPEGKIVLRYTTAIREKYIKYLHYLRKGVIRKDDAYVVAINKSALAYRWASAAIDLPRFLKAVYPIGELEVLIDKRARKVVGAQNRARFFITKANKSPVPVQAFVDRRWRGLSAVICSDVDVGWSKLSLGHDFQIAYNPLSRQPVARGIIPAVREWWSKLDEASGELFCDPERE
jgi:hypothetical protein